MAIGKLTDMLNHLKELFKTPGYAISEKRFFEHDLQHINLQRAGIMSLFMMGFNILSLLLCVYYCYKSPEGGASSNRIVILHASIAASYSIVYLIVKNNLLAKMSLPIKGRLLIWWFTLLSYAFIIVIASVERYAGVVPSVCLLFFCGLLILFYQNLFDLVFLVIIGFSVCILAFNMTITEPVAYSGQMANLLIFSFIFLVISRGLYYNKSRELINLKQLKNQTDQLDEKNSKLINIENTLSSINKNLMQGLFRMDKIGNLIYLNDFLIKLFGYKSEDKMIRDWNLKRILSNKEIYQIKCIIEKKGYVKDREITYVRKDGSLFCGLINCSVTIMGDNVYYDGVVIDNTERKNNEKMLENLSLVASKTDNAVFIIDKEEKIEWVNESFVRITGYSFEEAIGIKPGILFQGKNTDPKTIMQIGDRIGRGESFTGELLNYRKDGSELWVHFALNPILDERKEIIKYVAVESDITERKNVEKELIKAKEQAEMSMKAKGQFLSMVSHELRTPLNAVIGMTHLLLQEYPREDQLQNLKTIKTSGEYLLALINDILDFSKIEAGKISIDHTNFSFQSLIQALEQTFYYLAREKNIRFYLDINPEIPNALVGDPMRLNQILVNLIGNSIKFTDAGHVKLTIRCLSSDEKNIHLKFLVTDTGIGIPADKLDAIFERFEQVVDRNKRGGTGLGLAITKSLVELMGGVINVESELGKGSEFSFDLYFEEGDEMQLDDSKSSAYNIVDNLEELHILLVEDNKINQLVASKFLKQWKVKFDMADNGQKAIELTMEHNYDMILMDLQMPVMDGISATIEIRKLPGYHHVPIIALTAASLETKEDVYLAGMNDFLIKPFNPVELYNKIKKFSMAEYKLQSSVGTECAMDLDITGIQRISDGDSQFLLKLLNMCEEQFKNLPAQLLIALKANNLGDARNIIHKIRPSIKMLQYYQLEKITSEFNNLLKDNSQKSEVIESKAAEFNEIISKMEKMLSDKTKELNKKLYAREIQE
jgi:PAS domain S-box-containing protein